MKVAVIGCTISEIISSCRVTISNLAKEGHTVYAIVAPLEPSEASSSLNSEIVADQSLSAEIGIAQTFVIPTFYYS